MAVTFDGVNDYIRLAKTAEFAFTANQNFMIDFWWYCTSTNYDRYIMCIPQFDAQPAIILYWTSNNGAGTIEFHWIDQYGNDNVVMHGYGVSAGWKYCACVRYYSSGSNKIRQYLGTTSYEETTSVSGEAASFNNIWLATKDYGGDYWAGRLARVRFSVGVTLDDIMRTIYPAGTQVKGNIPLASKTQIWCPMNETEVNNIKDYTGGATVTNSGSPVISGCPNFIHKQPSPLLYR